MRLLIGLLVLGLFIEYLDSKYKTYSFQEGTIGLENNEIYGQICLDDYDRGQDKIRVYNLDEDLWYSVSTFDIQYIIWTGKDVLIKKNKDVIG